MSARLKWHGHANFEIITPETNILIDPWFDGNPAADCSASDIEKADLVAITHDHADHIGQAVDICKNTGAHLAAQVELAGWCQKQGMAQEKILNGIGFNIGGTVEFKGIKITMTQAFHSCTAGTPVGFIFTLKDGHCIYHAGDTSIFSSMQLWGGMFDIHTAILPTGGVFTMDSPQAALACKLLGCKRVIPMHWGTFPALEQDTKEFERCLKDSAPETELVSMSSGQEISL
jgi:L-ascorbate metabolism protein UlaG (beta-lactamase superfamily)